MCLIVTGQICVCVLLLLVRYLYAIDTAALPDKNDIEDQYRCQTCSKTFCNIDALYAHQNELGHLELKQTPRGPGYLCWKKGCNQYFKTAQALQVHFREIHAKRQTNITVLVLYIILVW
jgi:AT-binding transcription factor 1